MTGGFKLDPMHARAPSGYSFFRRCSSTERSSVRSMHSTPRRSVPVNGSLEAREFVVWRQIGEMDSNGFDLQAVDQVLCLFSPCSLHVEISTPRHSSPC